MERVVQVAQELSMARDLNAVTAVVRHAARELTCADGATFVLRDGDLCFTRTKTPSAPSGRATAFP